ncbi:MAG: 16S rRNA (cytosine(1402)-N(4))-methyltransferase RsmH [Spirochaetaceae bacterium]|jgi:16S rRNA (cytosine1402-N4)-methyltransferase|nr:16S rRNA (cytosine(1402)-N(4))-methyltransferase RsmH [Spirochaetaceae bacterium]
MDIAHTPVLPEETLYYLSGGLISQGVETGENELFVDGTLGEGGHTELFLSRFPNLRVIGIDADNAIVSVARKRLTRFGERVVFHTGWADDFFRFYPKDSGLLKPGIILLDLGVSLFHYEKGDRGFSFRLDESLDMRIDTTKDMPASDLLASLTEEELVSILFRNAEERYARRIARAITQARETSAINNSGALAEIVYNAVPVFVRHAKTHPATKTFQALRIAVNGELDRLPALLAAAFSALKIGGRLGVISFHSLEDRIVKNFFRDAARDCICPPSAPVCVCRGRRLGRLITPKPVSASEAELIRNPPSRSAKLRVIEKVYEDE